MKVAIMSDIHAQSDAFSAALADAVAEGYEALWLLGDFVGRGADPVGVVRRTIELVNNEDCPVICLAGNHDKMVVGDLDVSVWVRDDQAKDMVVAGVNTDVSQMVQQHREQLETAENQHLFAWLKALPLYAEPIDHFFLAHGAFVFNGRKLDKNMVYRTYSFNRTEIGDQITSLREQRRFNDPHLVAVGHTHVSGIWRMKAGARLPELIWGWDKAGGQQPQLSYDEVFFRALHFKGLATEPIFLNPGSIGFPRQHDKAPTYILLDIHNTDEVTIEFRTVEN